MILDQEKNDAFWLLWEILKEYNVKKSSFSFISHLQIDNKINLK